MFVFCGSEAARCISLWDGGQVRGGGRGGLRTGRGRRRGRDESGRKTFVVIRTEC